MCPKNDVAAFLFHHIIHFNRDFSFLHVYSNIYIEYIQRFDIKIIEVIGLVFFLPEKMIRNLVKFLCVYF